VVKKGASAPFLVTFPIREHMRIGCLRIYRFALMA